MLFKMAAQAFEARDFVKIFLGWGFLGSFPYKHFSHKEACIVGAL